MGYKFEIPKDEYVVDVGNTIEQSDSDIQQVSGTSDTQIVDIPCDNLIMDDDNVVIYGNEDNYPIDELADDIEENGFKGAIMAFPIENGKYQIESGHRRYMAAKQAGLNKLPVIITKVPSSDAERKIRLISMNLHSRKELKPTVTANIIETLIQANLEEQQRKNLATDMNTLLSITSSQMELSVVSLHKYRQFSKLCQPLKEIADEGVSWSAIAQASTLSDEKQSMLASSIWKEIERVGVDKVSREWVVSLITRMKQDLCGEIEKPKKVVKKRNGNKIIARTAKEFEDIINDNVVFNKTESESTLKNLMIIKNCVDQKIKELQEI